MCAGSRPRSSARECRTVRPPNVHGHARTFMPRRRLPNRYVMVCIRRLATLVATVLAGLLAAAPAQARLDPLGFRFSSPAYVAHERDGYAEITLTRLNVAQEAQIRDMTLWGTAKHGADFRPVEDVIDFQPGQANPPFPIAILYHHIPALPPPLSLRP